MLPATERVGDEFVFREPRGLCEIGGEARSVALIGVHKPETQVKPSECVTMIASVSSIA
jgi:hypothetical protein